MSSNSLVSREDYVNVKSMKDVSEFSKELKEFVIKQNLFTAIQSKNYVNVEGWEFAGAAMGIFPVVAEVTDLSNETETKYKVLVELIRLSDDKVVGRGFAVCSSKEKGRDKQDEFVILSMAQTRATGKAFRLCIGWVMKLAGYEGTPSEEIQTDSQDDGYLSMKMSPQEKEMTRSIGTIRRKMKEGGYDSPESQRAFMKRVLGDADELIDALNNEKEDELVTA